MSSPLRFEKLSVARSDRVLLRNLSGEVQSGEILHLRGSNGVGKTTLLEVLCGLRAPETGIVSRRFEPEQCHWVGHRNALNPALTPFENLSFWCALNEVPDDAVRGALREFNLLRVADQPCRQLSAGQQRRTALARLALVRREVWFLDEPMSALDETGVGQWLALLAAHRDRGGIAIVTSHQSFPQDFAGVRRWDLSR